MFKNFKVINKEAGRVGFDIYDPPLGLAFVNALRRVILTDIPVLGFIGETLDHNSYSFQIHTNNGPLHNEIMHARLGLLPLKASLEDIDSYELGSLVLELDKLNDQHDMINVTTDDFKITLNGNTVSTKDYFPEPVLITRLTPKQKLHVTGSPVIKTSRFHAGFSAVSLCAFHYIQDISEIPVNITSVIEKERIYLKNEFNDPTAFHFDIEPETYPGDIKKSVKKLVDRAIQILIDKFNRIINELKSPDDEPKSVKISGAEFTFQDEDDTLGNLIQSYTHIHYIRKNLPIDSYEINYVGYYCPHPLDPTMVVKMASNTPDTNYKVCMLKILEIIKEELEDSQKSWQNSV